MSGMELIFPNSRCAPEVLRIFPQDFLVCCDAEFAFR
jgi:hypothetical protein